MINDETIAAFNSRQTVNPNNIKTMTAAQQDAVKTWGSGAENLIKNRDLGLFIHQYKFELCDALADIKGHTADDNALRVAISNQIAGIDGFVAVLQRAIYYKNRVVTMQTEKQSTEPTE